MIKKTTFIYILTVSCFLSSQICFAYEVDQFETVTQIIDGDSFFIQGDEVRLADVSCPEWNEVGGSDATDALTLLIEGQTVYLDTDQQTGRDQYGRIVAVVYIRYNDTHYLNVNQMLLDQGVADLTDFTNNEFDPNTWTSYVQYALETPVQPPVLIPETPPEPLPDIIRSNIPFGVDVGDWFTYNVTVIPSYPNIPEEALVTVNDVSNGIVTSEIKEIFTDGSTETNTRTSADTQWKFFIPTKSSMGDEYFGFEFVSEQSASYYSVERQVLVANTDGYIFVFDKESGILLEAFTDPNDDQTYFVSFQLSLNSVLETDSTSVIETRPEITSEAEDPQSFIPSFSFFSIILGITLFYYLSRSLYENPVHTYY